MPITMLPDLPRRWLRNVNHKQPVVTKDGLDRLRILPKSPLVEAVRFESQDRPESMTQRKWIERLQQATIGDYLRGRAFRRLPGKPLPLLGTGFLVLAAS